jgi:hypothetical protein
MTEAKANFEKSLNLNPEYQLVKEELSIWRKIYWL